MSASQIACMSFNNFTCFVCLLPVFILLLQCWNPSCLSCPLSSCLPVTAGQPPVCISITPLHLCCLLSSCLFVYWSVCLSASLLSTPVPLQSPLPAVSVAILPTYSICLCAALLASFQSFHFCFLSVILSVYLLICISFCQSLGWCLGCLFVCVSVFILFACHPAFPLFACLSFCQPVACFHLPASTHAVFLSSCLSV